jgi:hypothetical protein
LSVVKEEWKDRLAISAEDYLHGLISLVNELVRLQIGAQQATTHMLGSFMPLVMMSLMFIG